MLRSKSYSLFSIFFFFFVSLLSSTVVNSTKCGYIYDWGAEDIGQQYSTNLISASWAGFDDTDNDNNDNSNNNNNNNKNNKIRYEWAIISEKLATDTIRNAEAIPGSERCRDTPGFEGQPDVQDWTVVDTNYASNNKLTLLPGMTYWVVLRVTTFKHLDVPTSNLIQQEIMYTNGQPITISTQARLAERRFHRHYKRHTLSPSPEVLFFSSSSSLSSLSYNDVSSGLLGWEIALIVIAGVFAIFLVLVLIFIVLGRSKSDDKYNTNVHRNENVEKI